LWERYIKFAVLKQKSDGVTIESVIEICRDERRLAPQTVRSPRVAFAI